MLVQKTRVKMSNVGILGKVRPKSGGLNLK